MATLEEKLDRGTRTELVERIYIRKVEAIILYSKMLLEQVGKEKAIELVRNAKIASRSQDGRRRAEEMGNPKDLDTYLKEYEKVVEKIPYSPDMKILERGEKRAVWSIPKCFLAEAILIKNPDKDVLDVVKAFCVHDQAWAIGFNPDIKIRRVKYLVEGDDSCDYLCEID